MRSGGAGNGRDRHDTDRVPASSPGCSVDVHLAFDDADAADEALAAGDPDRSTGARDRGARRLDDDLLPDVDADWLIGYRTRLSWARTRTLQIAAAASRATGRPAQAVELRGRAVLADPARSRSRTAS